MANSLCSALPFIYLAIMGSFLGTTVSTINDPNSTKIVLRLIHRHSIFHTTSSYHPNKVHRQESDDIIAPLIPEEDGRLFLVNVSIGEPPVPQLLAMDTGSSLTWVRGARPIFYPETPSTYTVLPCDSTQQCDDYFDRSHCRKGSCIYDVHYLDGTRSTGILALVNFVFLTSTGGISEMPELLVGVETESHETAPWLRGILGLGFDYSGQTLVAHVGLKFSYCIGNLSDPHYPYNQLVLGDGAIFEGDSTPMEVTPGGKYVITLEGISVGEKQLEIDEEEFEYNVVLDSGSTLTTLPEREYKQLEKEVMHLMDGIVYRVILEKDPELLCYRGNMERDLKGFPTVTLHLAQDSDLSLDGERMFLRYNDNIFCLAFGVSKTKVHIIGIIAQQYINIGFDLNAKMVSFQTIECDLLED